MRTFCHARITSPAAARCKTATISATWRATEDPDDETQLTALPDIVTIYVALDAALQGKASYSVFRYHGTGVDTLPQGMSNANRDGEYFEISADGTMLILHVMKFSTYALAYTEAGSGNNNGSVGATTYYTVAFNTNGGSAVQNQSVARDDKATKPADPTRDGFIFGGWFTDAELTGAYDFNKSVTSNIILFAKWTKAEDTSALLITDAHIAYVSGYPDGTFRPEGSITRAETALMLYRLLINKDIDRNAVFSDVPDNEWYSEAVNILAAIGIINGDPNGTFRPDDTITRAEFVAMITRFTNGQAAETAFSDVADHWAADAISIASGYGWINGYPDGTFRPNISITRAEAVKIINAALDRKADKEYVDSADDLKTFTDLTSNFWGYYEIMEAANVHDYDKDGTSEFWK